MRRSSAPTLQDVARDAGVTAMAASVVLNGARSSARVSEQTRARILAAAARLGYRPNAVARGLFRRRMDTVGVVANVDGVDVNFYFLEVLNGILEEASERDQNVFVFSVKRWEDADPNILRHCDGRVDGLILVGPVITADFAEALHNRTPFVTIHSNAPLPGTTDIQVDDAAGAYAAVQRLVALGHRRIAHLAASPDLIGAARRIEGYRRALEEAGIAYDPELVLHGGFTVESGRRSTQALIERGNVPTGVFCVNDAVAFGCMEALSAAGLRVPEDVSVIGFDNTPTAMMTNPPLTTLRQPLRQMGRRAVEALLPLIDEAVSVPDAEVVTAPVVVPGVELFPVDLIVRASIGPAPAV